MYRGCLVSLLFYGKLPYSLCIMIPPILFGLSHAHHAYYQLTHQSNVLSPRAACFRVMFQLLYTSIFGILASIIFIRTGNVFSAMIMHIWCNSMGFPPFTFITNWMQTKSTSLRDVFNGAAYVCGLGSFIFLLYPLTNPKYFNSPFQ